jgi:hypothetical protein
MSLAFGTAERAALVATMEASMLDTCTVDAYTETAGELNEPSVEYLAGEPTACRYLASGEAFSPGYNASVTSVTGVLHLPLSTVITSRDRVTITKRLGAELDPPLQYAVVGDPVPGVASLEVRLQEAHL